MADVSPKPASRGGASRLRVAGRLAALAGLPLLVIFLIFASGVYCGASRSYRVQTLEARWLDFEPPEADRGVAPEPDAAPEQIAELADDGSDGTNTTGPSAPEQPLAEQPLSPDGTDPEAPQPQTPPQPESPELATPPNAHGLLAATAVPVGDELRSRFDEARVVRVKVLVDPALVVAREDWLSYVADLIDATHNSFVQLFGIEVQLQGVVIWEVATGANVSALLEDLAGHEREGADVILGLIARPKPRDFEPARWLGEHHGDHALVFADLTQTDRFYRGLLRALASLLGAEPANDAASTQLGSFMSDATPRPGTPPTLDPDNRGKVIFNKRRPFARSAIDTAASEDAPTPDEEPKPKQPKQPKPKQPKPEPREPL